MYRLEFKLNRRPTLLQRLAALILGSLALVAAFFLSLVMFSLALVVAVVIALVFAYRRWRYGSAFVPWQRFRARSAGADGSHKSPPNPSHSGEVLEASYTVIHRQRRE